MIDKELAEKILSYCTAIEDYQTAVGMLSGKEEIEEPCISISLKDGTGGISLSLGTFLTKEVIKRRLRQLNAEYAGLNQKIMEKAQE